jgi:hypothetical protein
MYVRTLLCYLILSAQSSANGLAIAQPMSRSESKDRKRVYACEAGAFFVLCIRERGKARSSVMAPKP